MISVADRRLRCFAAQPTLRDSAQRDETPIDEFVNHVKITLSRSTTPVRASTFPRRRRTGGP